MSKSLFVRNVRQVWSRLMANQVRVCSNEHTLLEQTEVTIPPYQDKIGEPAHIKRARLLYQSRKRGMLENGLLLSNFASQFLHTMNEPQLSQYDRLINLPSNDWEIYYWATGVKATPEEFDHEVMQSLKQYVQNEAKENRTRQPDL